MASLLFIRFVFLSDFLDLVHEGLFCQCGDNIEIQEMHGYSEIIPFLVQLFSMYQVVWIILHVVWGVKLLVLAEVVGV